MKQTEIPQQGNPQVSVLATLRILFGAAEADRIWRALAASPGADVVATISNQTLDILNQLKCQPTKKV